MLNIQNNSEVILSVNSINKKNRLSDIATFLENGAKVLYTRSDIDGNLIVRVMQYANMKNRSVFCFCEDASIKNNGVINDGNVSFKLGLPGISKIAEISEVSKIVELATFFDVSILFQGISTSKSVHILKAVKKANKKVFTEVPIHNLLLNESECDDFNTRAKLISPLRDEQERKKMLTQLQNGDIDVITSAHSPKSYTYKDVAFEDAKDGIDALGLTLKLGYTYLVKNKIISFSNFINLVSKNPAKILSLSNCGEIKEGNNADLLLFDTKYKTVVKDELSLYYGQELSGKIESV
jgi:dihydroorotase